MPLCCLFPNVPPTQMMTRVVLPNDVTAVVRLGRSLKQSVVLAGAMAVVVSNIMPLAAVSPALVCLPRRAASGLYVCSHQCIPQLDSYGVPNRVAQMAAQYSGSFHFANGYGVFRTITGTGECNAYGQRCCGCA